ncbi:hypothetical protein BFW86_24345 [Pseudomonas fluorescens]|nr:hypothetical protein BFW86_24345 [Pseudomonas fluorescens]
MFTQEQLKEYVNYNPDTGIFTRLKDAGGNQFGCKFPRWKAGDVMGTKTRRRGNIRISIFGGIWEAHRLAWLYQYGSWPSKNIDHINGDPSDNRIENLRDVPQIDNGRNQKRHSRNKTGANGVHVSSQTGRFIVQFRINGKTTHIGCYDTIFDAVCARKSAEIRHGFHVNHGRAPI